MNRQDAIDILKQHELDLQRLGKWSEAGDLTYYKLSRAIKILLDENEKLRARLYCASCGELIMNLQDRLDSKETFCNCDWERQCIGQFVKKLPGQ